MRRGKKWQFCLALLLVAGLVSAEVLGNKGISVTSTSATTTFTVATMDLTLINDSTSANEVYVRVFHCGDVAAAATTSSPIRLEPGEGVSLTWHGQESASRGYCAVSYVCDTAETASIRLIYK